MRKVYIHSDNIYSPVGKDTSSNMAALRNGQTGITRKESDWMEEPFYASLFTEEDKKEKDPGLTFFEKIVFQSAEDAISRIKLEPSTKKTGFILSTTKGNISLIENANRHMVPEQDISLNLSAERIAGTLGFIENPLVISHACISGLLAMITGMRLIQSGRFDQLVISGGDLITPFIFSGFRSFQAISLKPCRPFDANRDGINLGEAAATVILSAEPKPGSMLLSGGSVSNDANHISGPSRTGEELAMAINRAMKQAGIIPDQIDFISAHGTATRYNDDMEAKAIHLCSLQEKPVNSLKGYYGHTLGAAGIVESIITLQSMKEQILIPTLGFSVSGTEKTVNVVQDLQKAQLHYCLKTGSGFGGCNAAIILENPN